jgi:hypothetical protein
MPIRPPACHQAPGPRPQAPGSQVPGSQVPGSQVPGPRPQVPSPRSPGPQAPRPPGPPDPQTPRPTDPQGLRPNGQARDREVFRGKRYQCEARSLEPETWRLNPGTWTWDLDLESGPWDLDPRTGPWDPGPGIWTLGLDPGTCYCCWALAVRGVETTRRAPMRSVFPTRRLSVFSCSTVVRYLRARPKSVSPRCTR